MSQVVVLDNEAVKALRSPAHPKHRRVVAHAQIVAQRKRRAVAMQIVVPTTVRVEAEWDRTSPQWAFPNRLRITDIALDPTQADTAASIRSETGVSVADGHIGAIIRSADAADQITVVTSDPVDIRVIAGNREITLVAI